MTKLQERIQTYDLDELKNIIESVSNQYDEDSSIIFEESLTELERRIPTNEYINFVEAL